MIKYISHNINCIGCRLTVLLSVLFITTNCIAEPVKPELLMREGTTKEAMLEIRWPDKSVFISGEEIARELDFHKLCFELGDFQIRQNVLSLKSGLPVLDFGCETEVNSHRIQVLTERQKAVMVITLSDIETGKSFHRVVAATTKMAPAGPKTQVNYVLNKDVLSIAGARGFQLSKILQGGEWRTIDVLPEGYQGAVEWQCQTPEVNTRPRQASCYCDGSKESLDTTSCWGYRRTVSLAFRITSDGSAVEVVFFDQNFDLRDTLKVKPSTAFDVSAPRIFQLETTK